ncbi:hypothetical protein [Geoalkalibacter halelectricus]|uniref:hypothetical protein n=1 Tax=Geoalkalibacter halelectricus TaxID=2847045 RepID=UPI00266EB6CF|nr:hypothetical protein [Geoalkalibacter halelectricus]
MNTCKVLNIADIASVIVGRPLTNTLEPVRVGKDTVLHRFDDDEIHILTDGGGGFALYIHPNSPEEKLVKEGHVLDLVEIVFGDYDQGEDKDES